MENDGFIQQSVNDHTSSLQTKAYNLRGFTDCTLQLDTSGALGIDSFYGMFLLFIPVVIIAFFVNCFCHNPTTVIQDNFESKSVKSFHTDST